MNKVIIFFAIIFALIFGFLTIQFTAENPFMDGDDFFSTTIFGKRIDIDLSK